MTALLMTWYEGLAAYPFVTFGGIWIAAYLIRRNKRTATRSAMDLSFFIMIGSVSGLLNVLTGGKWGFWLLLFVILTAAGLKGRELENRSGRLDPAALFRWISRPGFLVLSVLYVLLWLVHLATEYTL
ncbi:DUF3397 family protein [Gorillibacterium sp. sgz5001074]|uniref:DUF3397 family protein n=1 Tax=Gorillibacterium sp. sgz5001074 TaxID=3446695 RepID=UPI003F6635AE